MSTTGLVRNPKNHKLYYVKNGAFKKRTGGVYYNGRYLYVKKGIQNKKFKGFVKIYGSYYKVRKGVCRYARYRNLKSPDHYVSYTAHCYVKRAGGTVMRYGPSGKYRVKKRVANGVALYERGYNYGSKWLYVRDANYNYGWVRTSHLQFTGGMAKPAIYLYPEKETDVSVKLDLSEGRLMNTAPDYGSGWDVTARPDGTIVNRADGREYPYLFWESDSQPDYDWSRGYVVKGAEAEEFLNRVLPEMGLSERETADFVEYWLPRMRGNAYNLVTFQTQRYTDVAKLDISPQPDSLLRVFMAYKPMSAPVDIPAPEIQPFERTGFTVVEWGGTEVL